MSLKYELETLFADINRYNTRAENRILEAFDLPYVDIQTQNLLFYLLDEINTVGTFIKLTERITNFQDQTVQL